MNLITNYSLLSRLRVDKPITEEHAIVLSTDKEYILFVTSTGMPAKNYDYYNLINVLLKPYLGNFVVIQAGTKDDPRIGADIDLCGQTNLYQMSWLIKNAKLLVCGDTFAMHCAGAHNTPFVALFGPTSPAVSGSYWGDKDKQIYLTPDNWNPSYNPQENPKQINEIKPEKVVESILKLLNISAKTVQTIKLGGLFNSSIVDIVPNCVVGNDIFPGALINIRYDKGGQEGAVYEQLKQRKCVIFTDKVLNVDILNQLKPNIASLMFLVKGKEDLDFLKKLKDNAIPFGMVSTLNEEQTQNLKLDFWEYGVLIPYDTAFKKSNWKPESAVGLKFLTQRRIISKGRVFLSYMHEKFNFSLDIPAGNSIIDRPEFWSDNEFYYIYA